MNRNHEEKSSWDPVGKYVFWGFALVAAYFLITEHRAHVTQYLPLLLLGGCVVMHFFHGHGGHGGHDDGSRGARPNDKPTPSDPASSTESGASERQHHR